MSPNNRLLTICNEPLQDGTAPKYLFAKLGCGSPDDRSHPNKTAVRNYPTLDGRLWLFSRQADFWLACGGASVGLLAAMALVFIHGDRELDALDFVLSEFHLGATYGVIMQRRLWRDRRIDVLLVPLIILALTYALSESGQAILLTSMAMYAAVWHRGRQSLGVARFYQRGLGGPVSRIHNILFRGAIYLPMVAATLAYTFLAPAKYEGQSYIAFSFGAEVTLIVGVTTVVWVIAYLAVALPRSNMHRPPSASFLAVRGIHPGEWWVVVAHAVAFGSAYVLGASNTSFALVLAVHHEVQYLYFTYAVSRQAPVRDPVTATVNKSIASYDSNSHFDVKSVAVFLLWPIVGFAGAVVGGWLELKWLAPLGVCGLFCHYWLDARIWTRRSFQS